MQTKNCRGKRLGIIVAAAAVILALAVGIGIYNTPANRLSRQLVLGQKYLLEQNYEQAIVEFDKAIAIDPMNVDAYLGKADAYVSMGYYDKAIDTLEKGYQATEKNGNIAEKLAEVYQEQAEAYRQAGDLEAALEVLQRGYEMTGDERLQALILEIQDEIAARKAAEEARKRQEALQTLKEQEEEISKLGSAFDRCYGSASYLTYEQRKELGKSIIELLETYKNVWMGMEDARLVNICGDCLASYYYAVGKLDQCLELRGELYEKTENDFYNPTDGTDIPDFYFVDNEASDRCIRNKYGKVVEVEGRAELRSESGESEPCTYVEKHTYGEDGKLLTYEGEYEYVLNDGSISRHSTMSYYLYDFYGRIEQTRSRFENTNVFIADGNGHYDYGTRTTNCTQTYTYTEGGFTVHDISSSSDLGESESYRHYVIDEYGNATEQ